MTIRPRKFFGPVGGPLCIGVLLAFLDPKLLLAQNQTTTVCIQTFNAYGPAYSGNLRERTEIMGEELANTPCQIVQLQEVWTDTHHAWALTAMARSLPALSAARFDDFKRPPGGQSGLAIFTSEVLSGQNFEQFRVNQDGLMDDVRGLLGVIKGIGSSIVTLRPSDQIGLQMLNVHLHPSSSRVRIAQVVQLLEKFERLLPLARPVVLTGDFNFKPDSTEYSLLRDVARLDDSYFSTNGHYSDETCTYCSDNPNYWPGVEGVIDYIWSKRDAHTQVTPVRTYVNMMGLHGVVPSDHFGLRTYLTLKDSPLASVDREEFEARRRTAAASVLSALAKLDSEEADGQTFEATRQKLKEWLARLQNGTSELDKLLRNLKAR